MCTGHDFSDKTLLHKESKQIYLDSRRYSQNAPPLSEWYEM
jgi:hypothetical protein